MSRRGLIAAASDGGLRHEPHRWRLRRSSRTSRVPRDRAPRPRFVTRWLSGVPFVIVIVATAGVLLEAYGTLHVGPLSATYPDPPRFSTQLYAGLTGWPLAPHRVDGQTHPPVNPAALTVDVASLDLTSGTVSIRVGLRLTDDIVGRLRMVTAPGKAPLPLARVSRAAWAQLPVGIQLAACVTPFLTLSLQACHQPNASVPLGELIGAMATSPHRSRPWYRYRSPLMGTQTVFRPTAT
jgi:hypothetical protein